MDITYMEYYPISLELIKEKVSRKNERENTNSNSAQYLLFEDVGCSNVKEEINEFGEKIIRVDGDIPVDLPLSEGQRFLFISHDQTALTHGLHKYPAKFFPELPGWLIKRYSEAYDIVLDPFTGSGTTNVEALLNRRHSVGIDIDPFSRYLSKVKTTPLDEGILNWSLEELLRMIVDFSPSLDEKDISDFPYRDNWFNKEIILELILKRRLKN